MRATGWLRALTTGTRVLIGALVAVVIVAIVIAAVGANVPGLAREALRIVDTPTPSQTVAVCPGPLLATGRTVGAAGDVTIAGDAAVVSGSPDGTPQEDVLAAPVGEGPRVLRLDPTGDVPPTVAAAQSASVADEDLLGFAAAACTAPQFESWLVGGATTTGSADLVVLANPGDVPATVQLTVYASGGALTPPGGRDIVIAAGSQAVVPLAGLALGELAPVVRVQAQGAAVVASLQSSRTQTLQPVGLDVTGPTSAPAERQVIVGLVTPAPGEGAASNVATASVRVLAPTQDVTATIRVYAVGAAQPASTPVDVPLTAGVPLELDLPGLTAGTYTVEVEASSPVVAAGCDRRGWRAGQCLDRRVPGTGRTLARRGCAGTRRHIAGAPCCGRRRVGTGHAHPPERRRTCRANDSGGCFADGECHSRRVAYRSIRNRLRVRRLRRSNCSGRLPRGRVRASVGSGRRRSVRVGPVRLGPVRVGAGRCDA